MAQQARGRRAALWGQRFLSLGLAAIPLACLVWLVIRCGVDVPYRDEWALAQDLRRAYQGTLSAHDLWLPLNEHRMPLPRMLLLALARLTSWNVSYELAASIILAIGVFALIIHQTERTRSSVGADGTNFLIPAISLTVFSLKQSENWLMGLQCAWFLNVLSVVVGIIALAAPTFRWWRFALALLCGVAASYSTANGLLYWGIALPLLLALPLPNQRVKGLCMAIWLLVAAATIRSYFPGGDSLEIHPLAPLFARPLNFLAYALCYLGNPVGPNHIAATCIAGLLGLLVLSVAAFLLVRSRHLTVRALAPYLSLALYSLGSALVTAGGRAELGLLQAKVSRYVTMATPLWVAILVLLYLLFRVYGLESRQRRGRRMAAGVALAAFVAIVIAVGRSSVKAIPVFEDWHARLAPARAQLLFWGLSRLRGPRSPASSGEVAPAEGTVPVFLWKAGTVPPLHPDAGLLMREIPFLKEHHLSVFRNGAREDRIPPGSS